MSALLELETVSKDFTSRRFLGRAKTFRAVSDVSFSVESGEVLGLVGESGCGKSTLARCITRLHRPSAGSIRFDGSEIASLPMSRLRGLRRKVQLIFQDPFASLNPRKPIGRMLEQALALHGIGHSATERRQKVVELLHAVGRPQAFATRYPSDLSGGQRQRVGIARALALSPQLIVADEPVSALDVSVQAEILNLLMDLRAKLGLTMIFISHDLGVIRHVSSRVGVMYLGKLVELAPAPEFYRQPLHPYAAALLASVPLPDPDAPRGPPPLQGDPPNPMAPPPGCRFHPRCPRAGAICAKLSPEPQSRDGGRWVACHFPLDQPAPSAPSADQINPAPQSGAAADISPSPFHAALSRTSDFAALDPSRFGAAGPRFCH